MHYHHPNIATPYYGYPQPWYLQDQRPYYASPTQTVIVQQPRRSSGDGLFALLLGISLLFTWIESRRQRSEIAQLQLSLARTQRALEIKGVTMNQSLNNVAALGISAQPSDSFGDGTHFVGENGISPGLYRVSEPGLRYYVARLRNFTGQNSILANWNGITPGIIEVLGTDAGVESRGGVIWQLVTRINDETIVSPG